MPAGLNRTDLNTTGITYLHGFDITYLPIDGYAQPGNIVDWFPNPDYFGNPVTWNPAPNYFGNPVTWFTPNPAHFGNIFGQSFGDFLVQEDGTSLFVLEDSSGDILLEN